MNIIAKILRGGGGKTLTYLLAGVFALCSMRSVFAEDLRWTGAGNGDINNSNNWDPKKTVAGTTKYNLYFETSKITNWQNIRSTAYINARGGWFLRAGTAEQPLRFTAENSGYGVKPGGKSNYASYIKMADNAESWAIFDGGTYGPFISYITVGSASYAGYLTIDSTRGVGTTVSTSADATLENGSIVVKGANALFKGDAVLAVKNNSEASVSDSGKIQLGGNLNVYDAKFRHDGATTIAKCINIAIDESDEGDAVFNNGTLTLSASSVIGYGKEAKGKMSASGLTLTAGSNANFVLGGYNTSSERAVGEVTKTDGDWTIGGDMILGNAAGASGVFTQNSGTVTVANNKWTKSTTGNGVLNLNGGTFATQHLRDEAEGGSLTVNFNGGTLKANAENANGLIKHGSGNGIFVNVGEKGGTIDTGAFDISILVDINNIDDEAGSLKFTGGGSVSLSGALNYTGMTTIGAGTALSAVDRNVEFSGPLAFEATSKLKISRNTPYMVSAPDIELPEEGNVVVDFVVSELVPGSYEILRQTGDGVFQESDAQKFATGENAPICRFTVSEDNKAVVLTLEDVPLGVWTGEGDGVSFSDPANWSGNMLPTLADDVKFDIREPAELELVCDIPLNVNSITFSETCSLVTINGDEPITCAATMVNRSEARHVVNVPVKFFAEEADKAIDVTGEIDFKDGVTGTLPVNHTTFYGNYTLTATSWTISSPIMLAENATVMAASLAISINCSKAINAETGACLTVSKLNGGSSSGYEMFGTYKGRFVTSSISIPNGDTKYSHSIGSGFVGVMQVEEVVITKGKANQNFNFNPSSESDIVVGGGTGFESIRGYLRLGAGDAAPLVLHSVGNWSFVMTDHKYTSSADNISINMDGDVAIDTSNYTDPSAQGFVVTIKNNAWKSSKYQQMLSGSKTLFAYGNGTLKFELRDAQFTGGLIASDGVTVAVNKDIHPGKGNVTIKDTATLSLLQSSSGTVPVEGTLTMEGGATLHIPSYSADIVPLSVKGLAFANVTDEKKVVVKIDAGELRYGFNAIVRLEEALSVAGDDIEVLLGESVSMPDGMSMVKLVQGNVLYLLLKGEGEAIWCGAGDNANFSTGANWMGGQVPGNGASLLIAAAKEATLVNDIAGFAPSSITFSGVSPITIVGEEAIMGVNAVTNLSSVTHTINVPVNFADEILVVQGAMSWEQKSLPSICFAGGVTGTTFAEGSARYLNGEFSLSTGADWVANTQGNNTRWGIPSGSSLTLPSATDTCELALGDSSVSGGAFTTGVIRTSARLLCWNYGEYVVTNEIEVTFEDGATRYCGWDNISNGKFKFEKITLDGEDGSPFKFGTANAEPADIGIQRFYIGSGGLCFAENAAPNLRFETGGAKNGATVRIDPWYSDYTIHTKSADNPKDFTVSTKTYFGTTDENGNACTVTNEGIMYSYGNAAEIHVDGDGTFLVKSTSISDFTCPVNVEGKATLAFGADGRLGTGAITLNAGTTLALTATGSAFTPLENTLNLPTGEEGGATIRIDGVHLRSSDHVIATLGNADTSANVALDANSAALDGRKATLRVDGGNLILNIKPGGFKVIVK